MFLVLKSGETGWMHITVLVVGSFLSGMREQGHADLVY